MLFSQRRLCARWRVVWGTLFLLAASAEPVCATLTRTVNGSVWTISNGDLTVNFNTGSSQITNVSIGGSGNVLDPNNSKLYPELTGTNFQSGTTTANFLQDPGGNYIDFWTTTPSNTNSTPNPITYSFHYVMFNNDPDVVCYEVLNHSATDPAYNMQQGQFLARVNTSMFNQTYQMNVGLNNMGAQTSTLVPYYSADGNPNFNTVSKQAGRTVQDATTDLTGSGLPGNWGTNAYTKYDYSSYTQFLQATTEYGSQYSVSALFTSQDTMNGGPTKQNLMFTNNISMIEFYSEHYGNSSYDYVPTQGVSTSKLFGPYAFRFTPTNGETGSQLYSDAVSSMPALQASYASDTQLLANGYVTASQRGSVQFNVTSSAGWSGNTNNNTVVLSDPNKDFQNTGAGYQYWDQLSTSGTGSIGNVVPGTYRVSIYQDGQWGETRYDNVQINGNTTAVPQNLKFVPENFGSAAPIWTLGTPDRSSHEFLNGHNTSVTNGVVPGGDLRQYQGEYDFWAEEQTLGNPGKVVYYATAVGSTPATNDPNKWIANQFQTFNPGEYDASNGTTDEYSLTAPAYVRSSANGGTGPGPGSYHGSPWEVHFTTTAAQRAQGQFVVLSVGLSAVEAALTVSLNGHSETWSNTGAAGTPITVNTDAMTRSGDAGIYEFLVFQFPTTDLLSATNANNVFTFSVNTTDGDSYDAMRMEITNTSADPSATGWHDYEYIPVSGSQIDANDALGLNTTVTYVPEPGTLCLLALLAPAMVGRRWGKRRSN
jgi:hypothetical protein